MGTIADKLNTLKATKANLKSAINGSGNTVGDKFSDYPIAVTNGKSLIAAAVTDKGVETAADATFQQIATNISSISSVSMYNIENQASDFTADFPSSAAAGEFVTGTVTWEGRPSLVTIATDGDNTRIPEISTTLSNGLSITFIMPSQNVHIV